jgi:hypothetical protein
VVAWSVVECSVSGIRPLDLEVIAMEVVAGEAGD